jgi:DNA-binding response OmpR family regulator
MYRVLIAESEFEVRVALRRRLTTEGFDVITAADATSALRAGLTGVFDVIVLDVALTDTSDYALLRQLRSEGVTTPVLLISASESENEQVEGLNIGGDGYLAIPFSFTLLTAYLRAFARRYRGSHLPRHPLDLNQLHIDPETGLVTFQRREIQLSPRECELLHALASRPDSVISKRDLGRLVWGASRSASNNVEVQISQVRRKLHAIGAGMLIRTVRGHGYMVVSDAKKDRGTPPSAPPVKVSSLRAAL